MSGLLGVIDALQQSFERAPEGYVPIELFSFTDALSSPGLPCGSITEVNGDSLSGKTSFVLGLVKAAESYDKLTLWIDSEFAFDPEYALALGINLDNLFVWQTSCIDDILLFIENLLPEFADLFGLVIIDSSTALVARKELQQPLNTFSPFIQYEYITEAIKRISAAIIQLPLSVIMINQLRLKMKNGNRKTEPTFEKAFAQYSRLRIRMQSSMSSSHMELTGSIYFNRDDLFKHKFGLYLEYGHGISLERDLIERCLSKGLLFRNGSWYTNHDGLVKQQGISAMVDFLRVNPQYTRYLYQKLKEIKS